MLVLIQFYSRVRGSDPERRNACHCPETVSPPRTTSIAEDIAEYIYIYMSTDGWMYVSIYDTLRHVLLFIKP